MNQKNEFSVQSIEANEVKESKNIQVDTYHPEFYYG